MSSASCSALAWAHLRAPSPDGMPFILGDRCPDQACAPGVGDQTDQRPRGRLVADDSSPPGEAAQSAPASPSLSSLWRKCVFQPNHNNTLGGGSEWTRPNEGDTSHHRLKKSERGNQDKIKHVFREQCVAPCVRRRGCKAGRAAALLSGPGRAGFAPPPEAHGAGGTRPAGGGGGPAFRRRCRLLPRWSSPPGARLLGCRVPVAASESLSLALSRRRGRRGAPAEGTLAREEGQGHGPSLRDSRSSLYAPAASRAGAVLASSGRCLTGATQRAFVGHCAGRRPEVKPWLVVWTGNFEALSLSEPESRPGSNVLVEMQRRATEAEAGRDRKAADRMNCRSEVLEVSVEGRQVEEAMLAVLHTVLLHRSTGKFHYKKEGTYSIGTVGTQDVDCDFIDFTYVRVSSEELDRALRKVVGEFKDALRNSGGDGLGQMSLEFYQKKKSRWPFSDECIPWEVWTVKVHVVALATEQERQICREKVGEKLCEKVINIVEVMNRHEYLPKMPTQSEVDNVFDTGLRDVQPYLYKISFQITDALGTSVTTTMRRLIKDTLAL